MEPVRPAYLPDPALSTEEMTAMQREIAAVARFEDDHGVDPASIALAGPIDDPDDADDDPTGPTVEAAQSTLDAGAGGPVVVGVDQAFRDEEAVSAAVAIRDGVVVERAHGRAPLEIPYVPGLLSFREGGAIVDALASLTLKPDLLVLDGSGRVHFREAGLATHVGVLFDVPAIGVAKSLLCGTPVESLEGRYLDAGERVAVESDGRVETTAPGTTIGYLYQSRQYPNPERRHVNPLVVSPGHRVAADTAVDLVAACCAGYKLPEPTRLADRAVSASR